MIANIFYRIFLTDKKIDNVNGMGYKFVELDTLLPKYRRMSNGKLFRAICDSLLEDNQASYIFLYTTDKEVLVRYLNYVGIRYKPTMRIFINAIYKHYKKHEANLIKAKITTGTDTKETLAEYYNVITDYRRRNVLSLSDTEMKHIPAEYMANMASTDPIAYDKFNSFRLYDMIELVRQYKYYHFNTDTDSALDHICDLSTKFNTELKDVLERNPEYQDQIEEVFKREGLNTSIFTKDMKEYISLDTPKGYTDLNLFKYNKFLEDLVIRIGFTIKHKVSFITLGLDT